MNILVGPNNCGKSTIIGAFRVLASGLRRARSKSATVVDGPNGPVFGYVLSADDFPVSIENVHTDYDDIDTMVRFRFSNGTALILYFPVKGEYSLIPEGFSHIRTPSQFRSLFPITVGVIPILGPLEHNETLVTEDTVRRELGTHRASRHFRNYWHLYKEGFSDFCGLIKQSWPGMEIRDPPTVDLWQKTV